MRPLQDVRVLSIEQYGAGPFASLHLAELGADVIKVEDPAAGGDVGRAVPPHAEDGDSLFFETFNRGKRSIALDLKNPAGRRVFEDLVRVSDAVHSNLRGDLPEKMAIRHADLRHLNERIVCCSLSGFGMTGPRAADPGYDYIVQGLAGWMDVTGEPGGPPTKSGLSLVDYCGGLVSALALVSGVHAARRDGVGLDCDLSLFDTAVGMLTYLATWHLTAGHAPVATRHSAHPSLVPFQNFQTTDGWIVIACAKEKFWRRLATLLNQSELADDPRFASFADRREHADALLPILEKSFRSKSTAEWVSALRAAGIPGGPVNTIAQALADEQVAARGLIVETAHPRWGTVRQPASPVRVGDAPPASRRAPRLNEHAADIAVGLLGYDDDALDTLAAEGAFGPVSA